MEPPAAIDMAHAEELVGSEEWVLECVWEGLSNVSTSDMVREEKTRVAVHISGACMWYNGTNSKIVSGPASA